MLKIWNNSQWECSDMGTNKRFVMSIWQNAVIAIYRTNTDHVCSVGYRLPRISQNLITSTKNYFFLYVFGNIYYILGVYLMCFLSINTHSEFIELISNMLYILVCSISRILIKLCFGYLLLIASLVCSIQIELATRQFMGHREN